MSGILGMHWGERRTEEQLARARGEQVKKLQRSGTRLTTVKKVKVQTKGTEKQSKKVKKLVSEMTDEELQRLVKRLANEAAVKKYLTPSKEDLKKKKTEKFVNDMTKSIGDGLIKEVITPTAVSIGKKLMKEIGVK